MFSRKIILVGYMFAILFAQRDNRIFWDGSNWNRIATRLGAESESVYRIKAAHLNGLLDGRLYYYLKAWTMENTFADSLYAETVDYLSPRELVKVLDNFYADPINGYIPLPSAIITVSYTHLTLPTTPYV